jgi:hypothetical protein
MGILLYMYRMGILIYIYGMGIMPYIGWAYCYPSATAFYAFTQ